MAFNFFRKGADVPEQKASATGPVVAYHGAGRVAVNFNWRRQPFQNFW